MTARHDIRCRKNAERRSERHTWLVLAALLSWLGCYAPLPSNEHVCRRCEERCPDGLVCHDGRCLPSCEGGCAAGSECVEDVCLPSSGEPQCEETLSFNLCVGRPIDPGQIAPIGNPADLVVVESSLPQGVRLDRESGELRGTPESEQTGRISVRSGELGATEVTYEVTATELCVEIATTRIAWCAGKDQTAELEASDAGDYEWQTSVLPAGVKRDGATLSGNIAEPGTYTIRLELIERGDGERVRAKGTLEIVVEACEAPLASPDAGAEGGAPARLQIDTANLDPICAGPSYTSKPLAASGGDGAYRWSLEGDTQGFSIDSETGVLTKTSPPSGHVELAVRVEDGEGSSASQSVGLDIVSSEDARCGGGTAVPVTITASALVSACAGAAYLSAPLAATGGDGSYSWSLVEPPGWLSLDAETNSLVGTAPATAGTLQINVLVVDGKGARDEASLALEVRAANDPLCAPTPLEITTTELAEACIGDPYFQTLTATGGAGDYSWRHNRGLPPGLTLQEGGTIRGTISDDAEPGEYQVEVRVLSGIIISAVPKTLPLRVRSCGALVFIGEDSATSRLLVTRSPYASARELSDGLLGSGEGVLSFRKSSSSSKLAFVAGNLVTGTPARLYMADAATREVRALDWTAHSATIPSVLDYVWSTDGTYVGVVASTAQQTVLAVVSGETGEITATTNIGSYQGKLFSVEEELCYLVPTVRQERDLLCSQVAAGQLLPSRRHGGFNELFIDAGRFIAGKQSYLAVLGSVEGPLGQVEYHDLVSGLIFPSIDHVFSPTLRWAAGLNFDGDQFELIVSEPDLESEDPIVLAPLPDCEAVLAWSKDEQTLVCQGSDDVRVFELDTDGSVLRTFGITASEGHVIGEARRVISEDGRWFAYDEGLALYLVDLAAPVPTSVLVHDQTQLSLYAGLELDAAGRRLFYHQASELRAIDLETVAHGEGAPVLSSGSVLLSFPPSCRLDYVYAPDVWCGADTIPATFFPSPEGDEVAFLSTSRHLHVANLESVQEGPRQVTQLPVKCTRPDGEIRCNEHVAWIRGR